MPLHYSLVWLIKSPLKDKEEKSEANPRVGRTPGHSFCFPDLGSKRSSPAAGTILVRASPPRTHSPLGSGERGLSSRYGPRRHHIQFGGGYPRIAGWKHASGRLCN